MTILVWSALAFTLGALPFSYWLGRALLGLDVRDYSADRNPGAGNAWRAGGWRLGLPAGALDVGKASAAVLLARSAGLAGWSLVPIALAPLFGHALSPFLAFRGGKSVAATFGVWLALTGPLGMLGLAVCFGAVFAVQRIDAWTNLIGLSLFFSGLLLRGASAPLLIISLANLLILAWTNRRELRGSPHWRRTRWLGRRV
ncbi:MAG: glycerol-3-phosphate acyltransferase [Thermoleophilia bacterium]